MPATTLQKKDDSMKGVIFIILGAVTVMCLALATGLLRPKGLMPMPVNTLLQGDRSMKTMIFIILAAVTVMCLVLATGYFKG